MPFRGRWSGGSRQVRQVDGEATRQMSSSEQVRQDASSECRGVRVRRRVVVLSSLSSSLSSCGSRCLFVAGSQVALDKSGRRVVVVLSPCCRCMRTMTIGSCRRRRLCLCAVPPSWN
jgi:hypothetical protein